MTTVVAGDSAPVGAGESAAERKTPQREREGRIDTVGTTVVVTNGSAGSWGESGGWSVHEVMRLGAAHAPAEETFATTVRGALGPDGNVYVLDPQDATIKVFNSSRQLVRQFGGEGEGPGELFAPTAMTWDPWGRIWVANAFNGRYTVYDSTGGFIKTVPRPIRGYPSHHQLIFDLPDSFVDMASRSSGVSPVPLFRIDTTGTIVDSLAPIAFPPGRLSASLRNFRPSPPMRSSAPSFPASTFFPTAMSL